jgi:predicted Zn-dependent peptidase
MRKFLFFTALVGIIFGIWLFGDHFSAQQREATIHHSSSSIFADAVMITNAEEKNVYLYLVFPSGEAANPQDEGLAHYVEHLAWLSALGGSGRVQTRHTNAWTNRFSTGYWQKTVGGELHGDLRTLISVSMPLSVEPEFALEERSIILREYDYRIAERPLYPVFLDMDRVLYGYGTLARSIIGEPSVIAEFSLEAAAVLHKQSHILSDATLLVYGDVNIAQFEAAVASLAGEEEPKPVTRSTDTWVEHGSAKDSAAASLPALSEGTFLYRKLVPLAPCGDPVHCAMVAHIAESALVSSLPGGLAGPLRFDQFVARSFSFNIGLIGNDYVEISFTAHPDNGVSLEELESAFRNAFLTTLEKGLTQETFGRVASRVEGQLSSVLDRDRPSYNRDLALGRLMLGQSIFSLSDKVITVESIRLEDVNQFLKSLLIDGREATRLVAVEEYFDDE